MKGGSVASSYVDNLVKPEVYDSLNQHFDSLVGGAKRSPTKTTKKTSKSTPKAQPKTSTAKSTDKPTSSKSPKKTPSKPTSTSTSKTSKTSNHTKHGHSMKGGVCMICGGSLMKHINEYDDSDLHTVYNKKGGSNPLFNIKYDITNAFTQPAYGDVASRSVDSAVFKQMAYDNPTSWSPLQKYVQYGNVSGSPSMHFTYSGGKAIKQHKK